MSNTIAGKIVIALLALLCVIVIVFAELSNSRTIKYDCRDAHWHPDIPVEVKRQCQELIRERLKQSQLTV